MDPSPIALNKDLADRLVASWTSARRSVLDFAELAWEVRRSHSHRTKGYNASFREFWRTYHMDKTFGSLPNFTKYAEAGGTILRIRKDYPDYESRLPTSLRALYEVSQLKADELAICFEDTFTRDEITEDRSKWKGGSAPKPLITPTTPAEEIRRWRQQWRKPVSAKQQSTITLARIEVDRGAFKTGTGSIPPEIQKLVRELVSALQETVEGSRTEKFPVQIRAINSIETNNEMSSSLGEDELKEKKQNRSDKKFENFLLWLIKQKDDYLDFGSDAKFKFGYYEITDHFNFIQYEERQVKKKTKKDLGIRAVIVSPTKDELQLAVMKEYVKQFGARRLLSLIYRSTGQGPWDEKKQVYSRARERYEEASRLEHELRSNRKAMFEPVFPAEKRLEAKTRVEELLNLLPDHLQGLSEAELSKRVQKLLAQPAKDDVQQLDSPSGEVKLIVYSGKAA
ncbi:MAG: hypothetical protein ACR652_26060 [Methylocystis sp.]|uniref:hypothetical protein n=1 Tax=Methylocystis sp. TaxID=1911079 RepID=UPI003DA3CA20